MECPGYLGIDAGTQGLSILFVNESLEVVAVGDGHYDMIPDLETGCYEQQTEDWDNAIRTAMIELKHKLSDMDVAMVVKAIGISGQMHGEVLADADGKALKPVRLWCDSRNESQGDTLTTQFGVKVPKRMTVARWLWTIQNHPDLASQVRHVTTPSGWIAYRLTGQWSLGIGDAAGMFPIDQTTKDYDEKCLASFNAMVSDAQVTPLRELLPDVRCAGQDSGELVATGAELLGLDEGIPVAPAEGDQPAALAGSLIGKAGMVSVSFGTSVCANSVGDHSFQGVSKSVDHFCAVDGKPINMVWLRNGTTFMNCVVEMFGNVGPSDGGNAFEKVIPELLTAPADCGGLLALPFMDDEPGVGVSRGGTALIVGLNPENATAGNVAKSALLATMFNLRLGSEVLDQQNFPRTELVLTGGLTKTPELAQLLADTFNTPVSLLDSAEEGTAWGAALLAKFRFDSWQSGPQCWASFLDSQSLSKPKRFEPTPENVKQLNQIYRRYKRLMHVQNKIDESLDS